MTILEKKYNNPLIWATAVFALLVVGGLLYVKWLPYVGKALATAQTHSLGASILLDQQGNVPSASWQAAGGLLAIPSMMCTCCAAPVVRGLRSCKASSGAAIGLGF